MLNIKNIAIEIERKINFIQYQRESDEKAIDYITIYNEFSRNC